MRIRISRDTVYVYEQPVRSLIQAMRVMPRDHDGQHVVSWRIEPSVDGRLRVTDDAFGNHVHHFQAEGPFENLSIRVEGLVETLDTTGFVRNAADPLPPEVFLRDTPLTQADEAMVLLARKLDRAGKTPLQQLHLLMGAIHAEVRLAPTQEAVSRKAAEAFGLRTGTAADMAHVFCGCARELGHPARFVSGYAALGDCGHGTIHSWAEALVPDYGWIGFDPSIDLCPGSRHVRVATGLDGADTAAFRQSRVGGGGETTRSAVFVGEVAQ